MQTGTEPALFQNYSKPERRVWPYIVIGLFLLFVMGVYSCVSLVRQGRIEAEKLAANFHEMLNREDFAGIYKQADPGYQNAVGGEQKSNELMSGIHRKMGNVRSSALQNVTVQANTSGRFITAIFATDFDQGHGSEEFSWRVAGGTGRLVGYNLNSPQLLK